jgi:signal transduction histidine kinase
MSPLRVPEIFRTPTFRLVGVSGSVFVLGILLLFAFIYWETAAHETREIDRFVERQVGAIGEGDADGLVRMLAISGASQDRRIAFAAIFDPAGRLLTGNLRGFPAGLETDGRAHEINIAPSIGFSSIDAARAAAARLPDGRLVVVARDVEELTQLQSIVWHALALGVVPAIVLAFAAGALLSWRALRRVRLIHRAAERILQGNLSERLPHRGTDDDFDRLATAVNRMLDEIAHLMGEIKGVGDDIAHDLRTPLTRVRTRLERGSRSSGSQQELENIVGAAIDGLDQTLGIVTALLRIAEIEDGRRRAAFRRVDLPTIVRDVADLYSPVAEQSGIALTVDDPGARYVYGDPDLLLEAIANIVDNAIKFAPPNSIVRLSVVDENGTPIVRVADRGPGIPQEERESVLKRFYRSDKSRHLPGNGLGLGLVAAILKLHHFRVAIGEGAPGCVFDIICEASPATSVSAGTLK